MTHLCVSELYHHCFRLWLVACLVPRRYMKHILNGFQGAQFIFDTVSSYLTDKVFTAPQGPPPSEQEQQLAEHDAFLAARTEIFVGQEEHLDKLDHFIDGEEEGCTMMGYIYIYHQISSIRRTNSQTSNSNLKLYLIIFCLVKYVLD